MAEEQEGSLGIRQDSQKRLTVAKLWQPVGAPKRLKVPVWLRGMPGGKRLMSTVAAAPPHATSSHLAGLTCNPTWRAAAVKRTKPALT